MTNFLRSSALKAFCASAVCAALAGCGGGDGTAELAESRQAFARRDLKAADKFADKAVKCNDRNVDALVNSARVKIALAHLPEARRDIAKAVQLEGDADDVLLTDAEVAYLSKDYAKAVYDCRKVAEDASRPADVRSQAYNVIGVVMWSAQHNDEARVAFLRALRLNPRNPAAWYNLGRLYRDGFAGYDVAALKAFEAFVHRAPDADVRVQRVQRVDIKDLREAIARKTSSHPGAAQRDSERAAALIQEAQVQAKKGNPKNALAKYEQAIKADPLSFAAIVGKAEILPKADRTPKGSERQLEAYKLACELQGGNTDILLKAAQLAYKYKDHTADAVDLFSRALASDPSNIQALDGLIASIRKLGGKEDVAKAYQSYREDLAARRR